MPTMLSPVLKSVSSDLTQRKQHELAAQVAQLISAAEKQDKAGTLKQVVQFLKSEWKDLKAVLLQASKLHKNQLASFIKTTYFEKMKPLIQALALYGLNLAILSALYAFFELLTRVITERTMKLTADDTSDLPFAKLAEVTPKDVFVTVKRLLMMPKAQMTELVKNAKQEMVTP